MLDVSPWEVGGNLCVITALLCSFKEFVVMIICSYSVKFPKKPQEFIVKHDLSEPFLSQQILHLITEYFTSVIIFESCVTKKDEQLNLHQRKEVIV